MKPIGCLLVAAILVYNNANIASAQSLLLNEAEIAAAMTHGPWPPIPKTDPSNKVSGNPIAIALGQNLFESPDLSASGQISCATCHRPEQAFTDGLARAQAHDQLDRNTQTLLNVSHQRWFGWDGRNDNLWAQSLLPIPRPDEMALEQDRLIYILNDDAFAEAYQKLFGTPHSFSAEQNLVNVGKALAAYIETLQTEETPFDQFRDALEHGDFQTAATFPEQAQRGFQIFAGKGKCGFCHTGPLFSNGEFHDAGVPYFIEATRVDQGRYGGIEALLKSPFTLDKNYSDDLDRTGTWKIERLRRSHNEFGTFRVPSLREVEHTAPYMHNGSLETLADVVDHYSSIDLERLHADGELILQPLALTDREASDLVVFLKSLSEQTE